MRNEAIKDSPLWLGSVICLASAAPLLTMGRITMLVVFALGVVLGLAAVLRSRRAEFGSLCRRNALVILPVILFSAAAATSALLSEWPDAALLKAGDLGVQGALMLVALAIVLLSPVAIRRQMVGAFLVSMGVAAVFALGDSANCVANNEVGDLYRWCIKRGRHRGTAFAVMLPLALGLMASDWRQRGRGHIGWMEALVLGALGMVVFLSGSRTGMIAAVSGIVFMAAASLVLGYFRPMWRGFLLVALSLPASILVLRAWAPAVVESRLQVGATAEVSAMNGRESAWSTAFNAWQDNPVFGVGPWNYRNLSDGFSHPHNFILELMSDTGLAGTLLIAALLLPLAWRLFRGLPGGPAAAGFAGATGTFFVASLAATSIFYGWWLCILFAVLAVGFAAATVERKDRGGSNETAA